MQRVRACQCEVALCTPEGVHLDLDNLPLIDAHLCHAVRPGDTVLYHGCGTGLLGVLALRLGASFVHFADVDGASVRAAGETARANGYAEGDTWAASAHDLLGDAPVCGERAFTLLLCNPPQMAGPEELASSRPDKYAGPDGLLFYRRLIELARRQRVARCAFMQTSFSSFAAVDNALADAGYRALTLGTQRRTVDAAAVEALAEGTLAHVEALRAAAGAAFALDGDGLIEYTQRVVLGSCAEPRSRPDEARSCPAAGAAAPTAERVTYLRPRHI